MTYEEAIIKLLPITDNMAYTDGFRDGCKVAVEALEKQIPMKPVYKQKTSVIHQSLSDGSGRFVENRFEDYFCPVCDSVVGERFNHPHFKGGHHDQRKCKFCNECGQAIDWGGML